MPLGSGPFTLHHLVGTKYGMAIRMVVWSGALDSKVWIALMNANYYDSSKSGMCLKTLLRNKGKAKQRQVGLSKQLLFNVPSIPCAT